MCESVFLSAWRRLPAWSALIAVALLMPKHWATVSHPVRACAPGRSEKIVLCFSALAPMSMSVLSDPELSIVNTHGSPSVWKKYMSNINISVSSQVPLMLFAPSLAIFSTCWTMITSASACVIRKSIRSLCIPLNVSIGVGSFPVITNLWSKAFVLPNSHKVLADQFRQLDLVLGDDKCDFLWWKWRCQAQLVPSASKLASSGQSCTTLDAVVMVSIEYQIYIRKTCLFQNMRQKLLT